MKRQFSKLLPALAVIGSFFTYSCGDSDTPEGVKSRQKGDPCDKVNLCLSGLVCEGGFCRVVCNSKDDCGAKEHCENSRCVANLSDACPTGFTGDLCDQCLPGFFGKNCQECNCSGHGKCNEGLTGDGSCTCDKGWEGENCSTESKCPEGFGGMDGKDCDNCLENHYGDYCKPCDCQHGKCRDGKSGDGQCKADSCEVGWDGPNCDKCADGYATENCVRHNCKNGTPNLGLEGDGHCSECIDDWSGTDCDTPNSCIHGTVDKGITGNGHCSSCNDKWDGIDCDVCPAGFYDGVTDCVDCRKVTGSAFGTDKCTFTDIRKNNDKTEQNKYQVVTINGKFWLAENLKAKLDVNGNEINCYVNEGADQYFLEKYGCLYVWEELATLKGETNEENTNRICPSDWRLPTETDFDNLLTYVNKNRTASSNFLALIKKSTAWTSYSNQGVDEFGFGALPAGYYYSGNYYSFGNYGLFWSSTEDAVSLAYILYLGYGNADVNYDSKAYGRSVRCLRDSN